VRCSFAGLRVLPRGDGTTAHARREHMIRVGRFGMVSIAGGKLTTHRRIALETLRRVPDPRVSDMRLEDLPLRPGGVALQERNIDPEVANHVTAIYGRDALDVLGRHWQHADALQRVHPDGPDVWAQVHYAVEEEWAMTVDDVVRRRTTLAVRGLDSAAVRDRIERVVGHAQLTGTAP
jgi:glycerol-3-phosphate dehydrogenase